MFADVPAAGDTQNEKKSAPNVCRRTLVVKRRELQKCVYIDVASSRVVANTDNDGNVCQENSKIKTEHRPDETIRSKQVSRGETICPLSPADSIWIGHSLPCCSR